MNKYDVAALFMDFVAFAAIVISTVLLFNHMIAVEAFFVALAIAWGIGMGMGIVIGKLEDIANDRRANRLRQER